MFMLFLEYLQLIVIKGAVFLFVFSRRQKLPSPLLGTSEMRSQHWIGDGDRSKDEALLHKMMKVKENAKMK